MAIIKDDAVILRRLDYSETSQVLAVFTRMHGKVRLIAKGIKRSTKDKFAAGLDLLDIGHLTFSARNVRQEALATLTEWVQSQAGAALRDALDRLLAAQYAAFVAAELTEDWDPHPELYDGICNAIRALAEASGLAVNTLSLIENGKISPSVSTLHRAATALGVVITDFFERSAPLQQIVFLPHAERASTPFDHGTLEDMAAGFAGRGLHPSLVTLEPHCGSGAEPIVHTGYEFVYCLEG